MNNLGVLIATIGAGVSLVVIILVLYFWICKLSDLWFDRWLWIRKLIIRKMIFKSKYEGTDSIFELNKDIDTINHIFWKYELLDEYDKDEKQFIKEYKDEVFTKVTGS